jgi:transposase
MGQDTADPAVHALVELRAGLERTIADLSAAAARADELIERRAAGSSWYDIVSTEEPPLVIETITRVLDDLGELGSRFRREEALALQREDISITRIGELFRVSRQRVSALLHDRPTHARRKP